MIAREFRAEKAQVDPTASSEARGQSAARMANVCRNHELKIEQTHQEIDAYINLFLRQKIKGSNVRDSRQMPTSLRFILLVPSLTQVHTQNWLHNADDRHSNAS